MTEWRHKYVRNRRFAYDAQSRLVSVGDWRYDAANDLWRFDFVVSNRYDHLGRCVQKITPAATHTNFYDAGCSSRKSSPTPTARPTSSNTIGARTCRERLAVLAASEGYSI